ncbi:MAG: CinA family protein, partial [Polaribacter sp.]
ATKISMLNVSAKTIEKYSVVSKEVALEMARGAKEKLQTNYAIAVTGNAGPTTDKNDKSLGTIFIALVSDSKEVVEEFNFGQPREKVINRTVSKSLEILQREIL